MIHRTHTVRLAVLAGVLLASITLASACSCLASGSPQESLEAADAVFTGEVTQIRSVGQTYHVTFDVSERWKGPNKTVLDVSTATSSAACGYGFQEGEAYLVYAHEDSDRLKTGICSRTALLADAEEDLAAFGGGETPRTSGTNNDPNSTGIPDIAVVLGSILLFVVGIVFFYRRNR